MKLIPVILSSLLALGGFAASAQERAPATVTVVGEASEEAQPDVAWLSLTIRTQKPTAAEASGENARAAPTAVIATLAAAGVEAKDIRTVGLALDPRVERSEYAPQRRRLRGDQPPVSAGAGDRQGRAAACPGGRGRGRV